MKGDISQICDAVFTKKCPVSHTLELANSMAALEVFASVRLCTFGMIVVPKKTQFVRCRVSYNSPHYKTALLTKLHCVSLFLMTRCHFQVGQGLPTRISSPGPRESHSKTDKYGAR